MGYVDIPAQPPPGGHCRAVLQLDEAELRVTTDLLKEVVKRFTTLQQNGHAGPADVARVTSNAGPVTLATWVPAAAAAPTPAVPVPTPVAAAPGQPPRPAAAPPRPVPQPIPQPVPVAAAAPPVPRPVPVPQPVPQPVPAPIPQRVKQAAPRAAAPPAAIVSPRPQPPSAGQLAAASRPRCKLLYSSDAADHNGGAVVAMSWHRALPDLPGGEGHGGWLISSSSGVLNLWECNRGSGEHEPLLMCMHTQGVEEVATCLSAEVDLRLLLAAATSPSAREEFIAVHSLSSDVLLTPRYYFTPPPNAHKTFPRMMQQVISVHGINPALNNCCIGTFGERLVVFETSPTIRAGTRITNAKLNWAAHPGASVSALARFKIVEGRDTKHLLLSGASDGSIRSWSLMERPTDNRHVTAFGGHKGQVNGLVQLTDSHFASCGADGQVLLWDTTSPGAPSSRWSPDGTPVVAMACHPFNDVVAVSTHKGLYIVDMFDQDPATAVNALLAAPPPRPYQSLCWNVTGQLYAGAGNGTISVFQRVR